jgi:dinuclear metal center YbgI/SA1388 family protein
MNTVGNIYDYLNRIAPFANQEKHDNSGLLIGDFGEKAERVLVCLDVTRKVVEEAIEKGTDLIISHHPLMYHAIRQIRPCDIVYKLVKHGINHIAAHNNVDVAIGGTSDLMLAELGFPPSDEVIETVNKTGSGYGKIVELDTPVTAEELAVKCKTAFECTAVRYVDGGKPIRKIALCAGGGGGYIGLMQERNCEALICGDIKHDVMVFAYNYGLTLIDAGHFHTENILCGDLVLKLQKEFPEISVEKSTNSIDVCEYVL